MPDAGARNQLQNGVEHAQPRAQHRHDDDPAADPACVRRTEWRRNRPVARGDVAGRFGGEQEADADRHPPEQLRGRGASLSVARASCTSGCSMM